MSESKASRGRFEKSKTSGCLVALSLCVIGVVGAVCWFNLTYYDELHDIEELISQTPNAKLVRSWGNEDLFLEDIGAEVAVGDHGFLEFRGLTRGSFTEPDQLLVSRVGDLEITVSGCKYEGNVRMDTGETVPTYYWHSARDISPHGDFVGEIVGGVENVPQAIARYRELEEWARSSPRCPDDRLIENDEGWYRFCFREVGSKTSAGGPSYRDFQTGDYIENCADPAARFWRSAPNVDEVGGNEPPTKSE